MRTFKILSFLLLFSLLLSACADYGLGSVTQAPTEATPPIVQATVTQAQHLVTSTPTVVPTQVTTPTGAWLSLSPFSGKPGDTVQIEGYNPSPPTRSDLQSSNYQTYTNVCWDGCQVGLSEQGIETTWSQTDPGHFSLSFVVPAAAWLSSDGPHNLIVGDYPVSVQYLDAHATNCANSSPKGCMVEIQSINPFHLIQAASGPTCQNLACGTLSVSSVQGAPGATIKVSGWAPLLQLYGNSNAPMSYAGYSLELLPSQRAGNLQNLFNYGYQVSQSADGQLSGSFQVPESGQNGSIPAGVYTLGLNADSLANAQASKTTGERPVLVATTAFTISAAPSWAQLNTPAPLWIDPSASLLSPTIGVDPTNPARLAYCTLDAIKISQDGGKTWSPIPTGPVIAAADAKGYTIGFGSQPPQATCNTVILDPPHPQSYYAVFSAANKQYGAPPIYYLGFYTTDNGKTWQLTPTPPDQGTPPMIERFGGYRNAGQGIQALYSGVSNGQPGEAPPILVEQTSDGGQTWGTGFLACLASGPCLQWGAAPSSISGMGAGLPQFVLASNDKGQTWTSVGQSVELHSNGPFELAALSGNEAVLISGDAQYPLLVTQDDGKSWQAYMLPSLPGANQSNGFQFDGLQMLPNGSLVAVSAVSTNSGAWYALTPGAQNWCQTNVTSNLGVQALLQPSENMIWWYSPVSQTVQNLPLGDFGCVK